jgi:hypothetical protein
MSKLQGTRRSLAQKLRLALIGKAQPFRTAGRQSRIKAIRLFMPTLSNSAQPESKEFLSEKRKSF